MLSWISQLNDPQLKNDFTGFSNAGQPISEADLAQAFTDLANEVSASPGGTLTQSQLADLQSIANNISSIGATPYLQFITDAFVNGNPANAYWTDDQAKASPLGDLAVGSNSTQMTDLIGKWFLGTDLPSSLASTDGIVPMSVSYALSNAALYGANGPQMSDVNQGEFGDCFLMATLAEVAQQDPGAITSMITSDGDVANNGAQTYGVRFYQNGTPVYVTVNSDLSQQGNSGANTWATVVETAYAELQQQIQPQDLIDGAERLVFGANSFANISNGGSPASAIETITGATQTETFTATGNGWSNGSSNETSVALLSTLATDLSVGDDVILGSYTNEEDSKGNQTLVSGHAFSVYGYDSSTQMLELRNPWGDASSGYDVTFEESLTSLQSQKGGLFDLVGDTLTVDNAGQATTVANASVVAAAGLQGMSQITSFSVADTVANIENGLPGLVSDSKLTSVTATGTSGADTLNLSGLTANATINMGGNSDAASLSGTTLNLGSGYDSVILGSGPSTINYSFSGGGVEEVANFGASDLLSISLAGGTLNQQICSGGDWITATGRKNSGDGVFLAGVTTEFKTPSASNGIVTLG
jgi:hypothetical protein